jgi:hypothetical protein
MSLSQCTVQIVQLDPNPLASTKLSYLQAEGLLKPGIMNIVNTIARGIAGIIIRSSADPCIGAARVDDEVIWALIAKLNRYRVGHLSLKISR